MVADKLMNRYYVAAGVLIAGIIGPTLGISANLLHLWGKTIAAVCFTLVGVALLWRGILNSKAR